MPEGSVEEYARTIGGDVFETSAKTGHNINDLFYKIARDYLRKKKGPVVPAGGGSGGGGNVRLSDRPPESSGGCPC